MKNGLIRTPVSCREIDKAVPAFTHLLRESNCAGLTICSGTRIAVAFNCSRAEDTRQLKRSVGREIQLFRHHGMAGRKKRRR